MVNPFYRVILSFRQNPFKFGVFHILDELSGPVNF